MRAPRHRRLKPKTITAPPPGIDLNSIADRVSYVGSPEHKDGPSFAGQPRPRADASICDRALSNSRELVRTWLQSALRNGQCGAPWEGDFPRYVWHQEGETLYEARLVNRVRGEYKGYPLNSDERPLGM